jgi:hypothetical protein
LALATAVPAAAAEPQDKLGNCVGATSNLRYSDKWRLFLPVAGAIVSGGTVAQQARPSEKVADSAQATPAPPGETPSSGSRWTLDEGLRTPDWLHLFFTQRTRYEYLWNQFRPFAPGDDRAVSLRTTFLAEFRFDKIAGGIEIADSRVYLDDDNTPLSNTLINPVDFVQAYVEGRVRDALAPGAELRLRAGRRTIDVGSRRFVARNRFRNTINAFTGLDVEWTSAQQDTARLFVTVPVRRRPTVFDALEDNDAEFDSELTSTIFWGLFYGSRPWGSGLRTEFFAFGLHEEDDEVPTRDRNLVTPGARFLRPAAPGRWDFELEAALQAGSSRFSSLPEDTANLSHLAWFFHGAVGRTFRGPWRPRIALIYDHATGDRDPLDDTMERFDTLFGARRFELGPTGIWGAFARSNIRSPAVRFDFHPNLKLTGYVAYRPAWLASARDIWTTTLIWDPTGRSGSFLGHQIDGAARWWIFGENLAIEGGFAYLWLGEFPKSAPNGTPGAGDPAYVYVQVLFQI